MIQSSVFIRFLAAVWTALPGVWADSWANRILQAFGQGVVHAVKGSALCRFLWREGALPRSWRESVTCRSVTWLINLPCKICKGIYQSGKKLWDGSLCFRGLSALGGASWGFLGLFVAVMRPTNPGTTAMAFWGRWR